MPLAYVLRNHPRHALVAVSQRINRYACCKIQVPSILYIPHIASLSLLKHRRRSNIGRDHVRELRVYEAGGFGACWRVGIGEIGFMLRGIELDLNHQCLEKTLELSYSN